MTEIERLKCYDEKIAAEAAKVKKHEAKKKALMKDKAKYQRNQRTHRLCSRGALLERYLQQPLAISDVQFEQFLHDIFMLPAVQEKLTALLSPKLDEEVVQALETEQQEQSDEPAKKPQLGLPNRENQKTTRLTGETDESTDSCGDTSHPM